jgi:hypothetical protein
MDEAGYQSGLTRKAKGPLSSGPASEAEGGNIRGNLRVLRKLLAGDYRRRLNTTRWVGNVEVASNVVHIDAASYAELSAD